MKRRCVQRAYENIRPDEEARERMLRNILNSSEIPPAGKDDTMKHKKMKLLVIAAIISLMILLMGCAVYMLGLQDLKIGEKTTYGEVPGPDGNMVVEQEMTVDVISLHGFVDSPTYLAHQEWFKFYEEYDANHLITEEENFFVQPEAYEAYSVYNQELIDKVDEIAEKYGLKLLGTFAPFQQSERQIFYEATGVKSLLKPDSNAIIEGEDGYFYAGGNFKVEFHMTMPDNGNNWPYDMLNSIYYSKADYFDTVHFVIWNWEDWEQWNYTTDSGVELLIARAKSGYGAKIFHNREDAMVCVSVDGYYEDANGNVTFMTKNQLEQIAEQFDYSMKVESVDMDIAKKKLYKFTHSKKESLPETEKELVTAHSDNQDKYGYKRYIDELLSMEHPENSLFVLSDVDGNGVLDLLIGDTEVLSYVWTVEHSKSGYPNIKLLSQGMTEEALKDLKTAWHNMDKKPITDYYSE